jgi:ribonuclease HI/retron-type reverse transcriptase
VPVGAHQGTPRDYLRRLEREAARAARGSDKEKLAFTSKLLKRTADPRNLRLAWDYLSEVGGRATGVDGVGFDDLSTHEVWAWARAVSKAIRKGTYRPAADRTVQIPKASGNGTRTLTIPTVFDRVVQRGVVQAVQPYLDPLFAPGCLGFRPGKGAPQALARAGRLAGDGGRWVWITEDIRDAFNQVPQNRLLDILRKHIPDDGMMGLLAAVVKTGTGRGLRQGGSLSPLLLNVYLDWFLDRKWRSRRPDLPLIRVADDLLVLCRSRDQAHEAYADLKELLRAAAMPLKGTPAAAIWDLDKGQKAAWLGYLLRKGDALEATIAEKAWKTLSARLSETHAEPDSARLAPAVIRGWLGYLGPTYRQEDRDEVIARVRSLAHSMAFEELPTSKDLLALWQRACARWGRVQKAEASPHGQTGGAGVDGDGPAGVHGGVVGGSAGRHDFLAGDGQPGGAATPAASPQAPTNGAKWTLYTDGSCLPGSAVGGWAYVLLDEATGARTWRSGSVEQATNNRMELLAAIKGLEALDGPADVTLVTDSSYLARGVAEWLPRWKEDGWRTGPAWRRKEVKNRDLWELLDVQWRRHEASCNWVPGHSGCADNEECDRMAREAAEAHVRAGGKAKAASQNVGSAAGS